MLTTILAGALLAGGLVQQTDTVIPIPREGRLVVSGLGGEVVVRTWARSELRVQADHSSRDRVEVSVTGGIVKVQAKSQHGAPRAVDYRLTIPPSMDLDIGGTYLDVDVQGVQGTVKIETVQGDVLVRGGTRFVTAHSVQGDVDVGGARGRVAVESVNGEVSVTDVVGELTAETVNGDITLDRIDSRSVETSTVNGEIRFQGVIHDDGRYLFNTHNGDLVISIPTGTNATVSVSTFNGEFESEFPVTLTDTSGKRFTFTLGKGSARLELESFGGTIRLERPRSGAGRR